MEGGGGAGTTVGSRGALLVDSAMCAGEGPRLLARHDIPYHYLLRSMGTPCQ